VSEVDELVDAVEEARQYYLAALADLSAESGHLQVESRRGGPLRRSPSIWSTLSSVGSTSSGVLQRES
jgi:hypothetical protein